MMTRAAWLRCATVRRQGPRPPRQPGNRDNADILRERGGKQESHWDDIISACLNLDAPIDDETLRNLLGLCADAEKFKDFVVALEQSSGTGTGSKASALLRMLKGIVDLVGRTDPAKLEALLKSVAQGFGKLSPELLLELMSTEKGRADAAADLVLQVVSRYDRHHGRRLRRSRRHQQRRRHHTPGAGVSGPRS
jgi:hypothetical protein